MRCASFATDFGVQSSPLPRPLSLLGFRHFATFQRPVRPTCIAACFRSDWATLIPPVQQGPGCPLCSTSFALDFGVWLVPLLGYRSCGVLRSPCVPCMPEIAVVDCPRTTFQWLRRVTLCDLLVSSGLGSLLPPVRQGVGHPLLCTSFALDFGVPLFPLLDLQCGPRLRCLVYSLTKADHGLLSPALWWFAGNPWLPLSGGGLPLYPRGARLGSPPP